jgi:DNA-binding transcriptional ArsR family regulator
MKVAETAGAGRLTPDSLCFIGEPPEAVLRFSMASATPFPLPDEIREEETASARLVYLALAVDGPLTYEELVTRTGVARSSVRRAIAELEERGVVERGPDLTNPSRRRVRLVADEEDTEMHSDCSHHEF